MFDPFTTTKTHGMGLGLAICRTIIERHRGQLNASSDGKTGASFQVADQVAGQSPRLMLDVAIWLRFASILSSTSRFHFDGKDALSIAASVVLSVSQTEHPLFKLVALWPVRLGSSALRAGRAGDVRWRHTRLH
jgi:hypothetical protein